jgi:hypothetical protein
MKMMVVKDIDRNHKIYIIAQMFYFYKVITHLSPLYPPFPKFWEGGKEVGK